jgi:deoxyribose-phosphate aldolase
MVVNVGALIGGDTETVLKDIRAVTEACRDGGAVSKVIIETALLDDDQKRTVCELAKKARANFVKTSTGFSTGGATAEDIALMSSIVASAGMEVKASGGIKSFDDVQEMISAGATRIGASASIAILSQAGK